MSNIFIEYNDLVLKYLSKIMFFFLFTGMIMALDNSSRVYYYINYTAGQINIFIFNNRK